MIKTDKRLLAILNEVEGDTLADIGCDHGKVVISAVLSGKAKKGIAIDISSDSLNKAILLAAQHNVDKDIEFIAGDGLTPIQNQKPDCIVIAGLGGNEITKILSKKEVKSKYILVAHQDVAVLRKYLMENAFFVHKDYVIKESERFYDIIVATKGESNYSIKELYTGKNKPFSEDYFVRAQSRKKKLEKIINSVDIDKLSGEIKDEWEEINNALQNKRCD